MIISLFKFSKNTVNNFIAFYFQQKIFTAIFSHTELEFDNINDVIATTIYELLLFLGNEGKLLQQGMVVVENSRELSIGENFIPKNNVRDVRLTYNELNANDNSIIAFPFFSLLQLASFKKSQNQQLFILFKLDLERKPASNLISIRMRPTESNRKVIL